MSMSKQEIFDKVSAHLLKQNTKSRLPAEYFSATTAASMSVASACAYRGVNGTMCAAGCLIKDEFYTKALEGHSVNDQSVQTALTSSGVDNDGAWKGMISFNMTFIRELQLVHDSYEPHEWHDHLEILAKCHSLHFNPA